MPVTPQSALELNSEAVRKQEEYNQIEVEAIVLKCISDIDRNLILYPEGINYYMSIEYLDGKYDLTDKIIKRLASIYSLSGWEVYQYSFLRLAFYPKGKGPGWFERLSKGLRCLTN